MDFLKCQRSSVGFSVIASDELENVGKTKYIRSSLGHEETRSISWPNSEVSVLYVLIVVNAEPFTSAWTCSYETKLECGVLGVFTHSPSVEHSQCGLFHHRLWFTKSAASMPLEAQSAGLSSDLT